jgi:hypothetical protein
MVALLLHRSRCDGTTVGFPAAIRISAQRLQRVSRSPAAAAVGASALNSLVRVPLLLGLAMLFGVAMLVRGSLGLG